MNDYILGKIEQELKDYGVSAGGIQDIVEIINNETQDVVDRRTYLETELKKKASFLLDQIANEWRLIGGRTPLPGYYRTRLGDWAAAFAEDYAKEIIRYQQKEDKFKNDKTRTE